MFPTPLTIFGPVVAPLVVATLVFIVIAAITGGIASSIKLSTPIQVGLAFLIGGLAAAKAHSWANAKVNTMMHGYQQYTSANSVPVKQHVSEPASSSGGLPPIVMPAHLMPQ